MKNMRRLYRCNGPVIFNGGYYFGNGGDSFDCGDGYSITYNGGTVLATSMSGGNMTYAYGDSKVLTYSGAEVTGGENISTLGQPAVYISGTASVGTAKTLGQGGSTDGNQPGGPGGPGGWG